MHVLNICLTYNRHQCLKRALRCFLDQDYEGEQTLMVYNTGKKIEEVDMDFELPDNKRIIIANGTNNLHTRKEYDCVGDKYNDVISMIEGSIDVVTHFDDDDVFLPYFNRLGVEGFKKAKEEGYEAYKTYFSYFRDAAGMHVESNNFEPSIFVDYDWVKEHGYYSTNVTFHDKWYKPLLKEQKLFVDRVQKPLFIYDWHPELKIYKMSGGADTPENYNMSTQLANDFVDEPLSPNESNERWYEMINNVV